MKYLMSKELINKNVFLCHKKNLVSFERWDGLKDEKLKYYESLLKHLSSKGRIHEKLYIGENCLKRWK